MNEIQTESIYERINIIGKGGCATVELVRNKYNHVSIYIYIYILYIYIYIYLSTIK